MSVIPFPPVQTQIVAPVAKSKSFYRPELDLLRFFAFFLILIHHGPDYPGFYSNLRSAGGYGLSIFFVLSAYLITELLFKERVAFGTVHLKAFYVRRILRIWPLYFTALGICVLLSRIPPFTYWLSVPRILSFVFFVVNWVPGGFNNPISPLWSISIEEQFYLIWPLITKLGGRTFIWVASLGFLVIAVLMVMTSKPGQDLWYSTFVEFLFFAVGAILSLCLGEIRPAPAIRIVLAGFGFSILLGSATFASVGSEKLSHLEALVVYFSVATGCALIFLSLYRLERVPGILAYFGKISYGSYVFHLGMLMLCQGFFKGLLGFWYVASVDVCALVLSLVFAHVSYQYLEKPFLRLKEKFAFVHSRTI